MNRIFCAAIAATLLLTSCHDSLEDRAEKEAKKYTERYCPTPVRDNQRADSLTFDCKTHTYNYYYTLVGPADNPDAINQNKAKLTNMLVQGVKNDTRMQTYKEAGFKFHFIYRSESTGKVLLDFTVKDFE